jgi:DNA-binding MarR family transcriptional regulator
MEERGLIARNRDKNDRRVVNITLLPKGHAMTRMLAPRMVDFWNEMLEEFSPAESVQLVSLLTRLLTQVESKIGPEGASTRAKREP